ncbi:MAG: polymerase, sigma-24 subunit, subfamily [Candidatus Nomurabacteria bacterium]|nr:polymerase, sigma-24 subunit, subfamily [Candidatus Nomurabacteria bacterium]
MLSQNNNKPVIYGVGDTEEIKKLILLAKEGDKEAFGKVYTELYTPLYRYVISRSKNVELAEDICQQTFLKFYEALGGYQPNKSPLAYLFTIAKHLLINEGTKQGSVEVDESIFETTSDDSVDIIETTHIHLLAETINEYLPSLTHDEQEVIRLYFYSELGYKEISEVLDKEEASVRKIKERALKKLRALTKHLHG